MKPIVEKVLKGGLVDKATAKMMEAMGLLPEGAAEVVNEEGLKGKTKAQLMAFAEDIGEEVEREHKIRETFLDLDRLRWPAVVHVYHLANGFSSPEMNAVIDRQGRYYLRFQDVDPSLFTPGFSLRRKGADRPETILESQVLYIEDTPVCVQVSTRVESKED
jgi:hypothetical protein